MLQYAAGRASPATVPRVVRDAYLAMTPEGARKESIKGLNDTEVVIDAIRHCGGYIVVATDAKGAADKKAKTTPG
jgi:hypothetical protein